MSKIFKAQIPNNLVFELLEKICVKNTKYYTLNNESFKKGIYTEDIQNFINVCIPFYHISKRKYLERNLNCNSFITILRQICKNNKILYRSSIQYYNSTYDIIYYIYF
jgi:hypothetical protein